MMHAGGRADHCIYLEQPLGSGALLLVSLVLLFSGLACQPNANSPRVVTIWHQMTAAERVPLQEAIKQFHRDHPRIQINALYKETDELRNGFQAAALAGAGPDLIYGPSDAAGAFAPMGIIQDLNEYFSPQQLTDYSADALTYGATPQSEDARCLLQIGDRLGNHLALVINRDILDKAPQTTDELIELAVKHTRKINGKNQYGLVFNFTEPYWAIPFITGHGGWILDEQSTTLRTNLDSSAMVQALTFIRDLQSKHRVLPAGCDYEMADTLFKSGQAAMIINGDWSWGDYLNNERIDAVVASLPIVSTTGITMSPMISPRGYSLSSNSTGPQAEDAIRVMQYLLSAPVQKNNLEALKSLPSHASVIQAAETDSDPTVRASLAQRKTGRLMPTHPELRGIWEAMKPHYQALLGGDATPQTAATSMQTDAVANIARMNEQLKPGIIVWILQGVAFALACVFLWWQRFNFKRFLGDIRSNNFAYLLVAPAMLVLVVTIVYPFLYNIALSFSNMSLRQFQSWDIIGLQNYAEVFSEATFFVILLKTIIWTVVCVAFSVAIGLLLAACLNGNLRGKAIYQIILILPWAVPAYITALTWRGMFDAEFGAVNLIGNGILGLPAVNWLGEPNAAFAACIITNIWLGFPFMMVIALGGMQGISMDLYEAARIDRVSRWGQFRHITLPMLKPVLVPAITLGTIWTFNNINVVWLVSAGGQPSDKTHILVSYVYKAVFNLYRYGYGAALSMVIFVLLLTFSLVFLKKTKATDAVA